MTATRRRGDAETRGKEDEPAKASVFYRRVAASSRLRVSSLILALIVFVVLLYGVIYPNWRVLTASLQVDNEWSLFNFREALSERAVLEAALTSVGLSLLTVLFCAVVGVGLAFLFERYTFPARGLFAALAALPLVLPPLV
ncbi:MAG TPA: hypothetical protein VF766_12490, partial [Pyrinomonadaceae bacterium]